MHIRRFVAAGTALLIVGGCGSGGDALNPTAPTFTADSRAESHTASRPRVVQTAGHFDANVDFSTLTLTPMGRNCLLGVDGQLVFSGTIEGTADGHTTALVFASCADVATNAPGTYPDVFRSVAVFNGTVGGVTVSDVPLIYTGRSQPGGHIDALFVFSRGVEGILSVDAQLAVGGSYRGPVIVR